MSEAPQKKKRKTRKEMLQSIILESAVTERNVLTIQKQFSQSAQTCTATSAALNDSAGSPTVNSTDGPSESVSLPTEPLGVEYEIECGMVEKTLLFTKKTNKSNEEDEQKFSLQPAVNKEFVAVDMNDPAHNALPGLDSNNDLPDNHQVQEESDWVLDYLEKIQKALQDEMENITKDENDADEEEIWYDAVEEIQTGSEENVDSTPLYENSPVTVGMSALLIMTFAVRHMITGKALHDLLVLISLHCGLPNFCFKTLYTFKKYFQNLKSPLKFHNYCSKCNMSINEKVRPKRVLMIYVFTI